MSKSIESRIDNTQGPFLEIGAVPSNIRANPVIKTEKIKKCLITSNVYQPERLEHAFKHRFTRRVLLDPSKHPSQKFYRAIATDLTDERDRVDALIDAEHMPIATGGLGALYATSLPNDLESSLIEQEAARVLEPGGILALDGASLDIIEKASRYFDTLRVKKLGRYINFAAVRNEVPFEPVDSNPSPN